MVGCRIDTSVLNRRARRRRLSSVVAIGFLLLVVAGHSSPRASYAATASAQARSVPPGVIVFSHEDSGSTNPAHPTPITAIAPARHSPTQ